MKKTGELKQVPDGYARNYLFPHQLATPATASGVEQAKATQAKVAAEESAKQSEYAALASRLRSMTVTVQVPANDHGKLFAAINNDQVLSAFREQQLNIAPEMLKLPVIKQTGEHTITVSVPTQSVITVSLIVKAA